MSKIKLTKGELKRQRDSLKQFEHYLPTLQLKKQQLQMKILESRQRIEALEAGIRRKESVLQAWVGLLADPLLQDVRPPFDLQAFLVPRQVITTQVNIAGANIPVFRDIVFSEAEYDLYATPLWVDEAVARLREIVTLLAEINVIRRQIEILQHELRITTQRVNLFEKVKIPECRDNIRVIRIYLGDQQANAVGIGKVAKKKIAESALVGSPA
ncbi:MAG: V-type ATP synthase subunit D [Candidatus Omnitrophota bacterium]|nr:V-type ATP synthase subunit D [Candidatus Omnitrophota bacterium]MDZ4242113.1 V-type ATP synthase subunit D [Candidatus Omnitrophota bacterium]